MAFGRLRPAPLAALLGALLCGSYGAAPPRACAADLWRDRDELLRFFRDVAAHAPRSASYRRWKAIANRGFRAAKGFDGIAAKEACRECHASYEERFRREFPGQHAHGRPDAQGWPDPRPAPLSTSSVYVFKTMSEPELPLASLSFR
jgi:hypothetical protein